MSLKPSSGGARNGLDSQLYLDSRSEPSVLQHRYAGGTFGAAAYSPLLRRAMPYSRRFPGACTPLENHRECNSKRSTSVSTNTVTTASVNAARM
jgi:hypothetical protein